MRQINPVHVLSNDLRSILIQSPAIWRDFGSALSFRTRLTETKPVLPLSNEHGSQLKDQVRRQCCHNKHKKFPYRPTRDVSLLSWQVSYIGNTRGWRVLKNALTHWRQLHRRRNFGIQGEVEVHFVNMLDTCRIKKAPTMIVGYAIRITIILLYRPNLPKS
jgi:hypothetical protein